MKFLSTYPNLQIVLKTRKRLVDASTGAVTFDQLGITKKFELGVMETDDEETIKLMLEKLEDMKKRGLAPSFSVHPADTTKPAEKPPVETKDDLAVKDRIILDLEEELELAQKQIVDLKNQVLELSQKKTRKKLPPTNNQV